MAETPPHLQNHRYHWLSSDSRQLYAVRLKSRGVDVLRPPECNIDDWLNPQSSTYNSWLASAIFYYRPFEKDEKEGRLELCIATDRMMEAAWEHGHGSQLVIDGTFGVCDSRMLLFIALVVDKAGRSLPVAFFLFSARSGAKQTSSDYDTRTLTRLIKAWRDECTKRSESGTAFAPKVTITDTDTRERGALTTVWPDMHLLLCKFHILTCWSNRRGKIFPKKEDRTDFEKTHVAERIRRLEKECVFCVNNHSAAEN